VKFDRNGKILNPNLSDYKIPTAVDVPPIRTIVIESDEPNGPYGAKEVGEGAIMPTIPAILNALHDATGIRFEKLPVTAERVAAALRGVSLRDDPSAESSSCIPKTGVTPPAPYPPKAG